MRVKRPPESDVPPRTTARMASSSRSRPALFPSALFTLELTISPAIPAQRPQTAYTQKVMEPARTPVKRAATGLSPIASMKRPRAVRRARKRSTASTAAAMKSENGMPRTNPLPMKK